MEEIYYNKTGISHAVRRQKKKKNEHVRANPWRHM